MTTLLLIEPISTPWSLLTFHFQTVQQGQKQGCAVVSPKSHCGQPLHGISRKQSFGTPSEEQQRATCSDMWMTHGSELNPKSQSPQRTLCQRTVTSSSRKRKSGSTAFFLTVLYKRRHEPPPSKNTHTYSYSLTLHPLEHKLWVIKILQHRAFNTNKGLGPLEGA